MWTLAQSTQSLSLLPSTVIGVVLGIVVGAVGAVIITKIARVRTISDARREAQGILKEGRAEADTLKKQIELDTRNDLAKLRETFDKEANGQRNELKDTERRLTKREDTLDRKLETLGTKERYLDKREDTLNQREKSVAAKDAELNTALTHQKELSEKAEHEQKQTLLRIANLSEDDARKEALLMVEHETQHEAAQVIKRAMEQAEQECKENAQRITLQALQRYATEHTADATVSAIPIPSDDMKGRVIGREGRNIRAFEKATGVDVIVDDTPGVVVVSCFDPIRRAVASESLQKLLDDGRIHPTRIEEVVD